MACGCTTHIHANLILEVQWCRSQVLNMKWNWVHFCLVRVTKAQVLCTLCVVSAAQFHCTSIFKHQAKINTQSTHLYIDVSINSLSDIQYDKIKTSGMRTATHFDDHWVAAALTPAFTPDLTAPRTYSFFAAPLTASCVARFKL